MKWMITCMVVIGCFFFSGAIMAERLRIAVASNFAQVLTQIAQQFELEFNQGIDVIPGSTGKFYAQIKQGAPFDIFLAADVKRPQLLEHDLLIIMNSRITYAVGQLALWTVHSKNAFDLLKSNKLTKLAIANPKFAPYGQAATEVLRYFNLYDQVKNKLVYGENVAQAFKFVQSGGADAGFVPLAFVKNAPGKYWLPSSASYHPIEQQLVILKSTNQLELARRFVSYLGSDKIKILISNYGYSVP